MIIPLPYLMSPLSSLSPRSPFLCNQPVLSSPLSAFYLVRPPPSPYPPVTLSSPEPASELPVYQQINSAGSRNALELLISQH